MYSFAIKTTKTKYDLSIGENNMFSPDDKHEVIREALEAAALEETLHTYPRIDDDQIDLDLRAKLVELYGCHPEDILLCPGSDGALELLTLHAASTASSDRFTATYLDPTYPHMIYHMEKYFKDIRAVPVWSGDDAVVEAIVSHLASNPNAKFLYLCLPNIPLGYTVESLDSRDILEDVVLKNPDVFFVIDEAYHEFGSTWSAIEFVNAGMTNVAVTRTFSKAYGLAGLRIGVLIAKNARETLGRIYNSKSVTTLAKAAALAAIKHETYVPKMLEKFLQLRQRVSLTSRHFDIVTGHGPFFLVKFKRAKEHAIAMEIFDKSDCLVRDKTFGIGIRIAISDEASLTRVLEILKLIDLRLSMATAVCAFDLDKTLVNGKRVIVPFSRLPPQSYVITNNPTPTKILAETYNIPQDRILSPAEMFYTSHPCNVYTKSPDIKLAAAAAALSLSSEDQTLNFATADMFEDVYEMRRVFYVSEIEDWCPPSGSPAKAIAIGKPFFKLPPKQSVPQYMVGDLDSTDGEQARLMGSTFVHISPNNLMTSLSDIF